MSNKYKFDITYIYGAGRKVKLKSNEDFGKEFFYGYPYFENKDYSMNIIETVGRKHSPAVAFLINFLDKTLSKATKLLLLRIAPKGNGNPDLTSFINLRKFAWTSGP